MAKFFQPDNLRDLSAEDLDQLRAELRTLKRGVRAELQSRQRSCAYCGQRVGHCLQGYKYCSAWHHYLDAHNGAAPLSRLQFESRRALHRLRALRRPAAESAPGSAADTAEAVASPADAEGALRNLRIRQVFKEFRGITGEALSSAVHAARRRKTPGA